ncbi:MAG: hypothetical protein EHM36_00375 [Deltaproteobacteria bacterium]|nr:MAG: hypothetical protein EHM36_00375 [Deltaproteobacteria bacterium]
MLKRILTVIVCGLFLLPFIPSQSFSQGDKIVQLALSTIKSQMRLPKEAEIQFVEKKESPIQDFYSVKFIVMTSAWEIPLIVYVDKAGERIITGNLFVKGENVTRKEAGEPRSRKIDLGKLEIEKSPYRGSPEAKVTLVEFSNFECPYCLNSWGKTEEILGKHSSEIKYIFKHFPFQNKGRTFELSEIAAAAQAIGNEAFWLVHDFLFSPEGQILVPQGKEAVKEKAEQLLKEKGFDMKGFHGALDNGRARKRVEEDMALGNRYQVSGTPTVFINGEMHQGPLTEQALDRYLKR